MARRGGREQFQKKNRSRVPIKGRAENQGWNARWGPGSRQKQTHTQARELPNWREASFTCSYRTSTSLKIKQRNQQKTPKTRTTTKQHKNQAWGLGISCADSKAWDERIKRYFKDHTPTNYFDKQKHSWPEKERKLLPFTRSTAALLRVQLYLVKIELSSPRSTWMEDTDPEKCKLWRACRRAALG